MASLYFNGTLHVDVVVFQANSVTYPRIPQMLCGRMASNSAEKAHHEQLSVAGNRNICT